MGTLLSNLAPASRLDVLMLDSLDVIMISIMALLMWWAFGWRAVFMALGLLGFVWAAFDPRKQALHDKAAGTVVIHTS